MVGDKKRGGNQEKFGLLVWGTNPGGHYGNYRQELSILDYVALSALTHQHSDRMTCNAPRHVQDGSGCHLGVPDRPEDPRTLPFLNQFSYFLDI